MARRPKRDPAVRARILGLTLPDAEPAPPRPVPPLPSYLLKARKGAPIPRRDAVVEVTEPKVEAATPSAASAESKKPERTRLSLNLERLLAERGISGRELSRRTGKSLDVVRNIISGRSQDPQTGTVRLLADALGVPLEALYGEGAVPVRVKHPSFAADDIDAWGGVRGEWSFPDWVAPGAGDGDVVVMRVLEGDVPPGLLPNDRLIVDKRILTPSPAGYFVLWDGTSGYPAHLRPVIGKQDVVSVAVSQDGRQEIPVTELKIVARVVGKFSAL